MLVCKFFCNVNNSRALIGLGLLVTSQWGQIWDSWDSQACTIVHIVICLSLHKLHNHSYIHPNLSLILLCMNSCNIYWISYTVRNSYFGCWISNIRDLFQGPLHVGIFTIQYNIDILNDTVLELHYQQYCLPPIDLILLNLALSVFEILLTSFACSYYVGSNWVYYLYLKS